MKHILKYTEWESSSGWHSGDISDLANNSNYWGLPAQMLGISLCNYILLLVNKFNAINLEYFEDKNLLFWQWKNYIDCHKFTQWINQQAKKNKFYI